MISRLASSIAFALAVIAKVEDGAILLANLDIISSPPKFVLNFYDYYNLFIRFLQEI